MNLFRGTESHTRLIALLLLYKDGVIGWLRPHPGNYCSLVASAAKEIKADTLAIFGSSILKTANGDNSPQMVSNHNTGLIILSTTMNRIIRSSFSEEDLPANYDSTQFAS